jgi:hypothetical protein
VLLLSFVRADARAVFAILQVRASTRVQVARDVEDPFHYDPNELPLPQIQYRFNERLLAVSRTARPVAFTDVADLAGPGNKPVAVAGGTPARPFLLLIALLCA